MPSKPRLRERVEHRIAERISKILMPGQIQKEARALAVRQMAKSRGLPTARRPDPDQSGYVSLKQEGSVFTQIARHSRNDIVVSKSKNRLLWRRRVKPQVLAGMYDVESWINAGINEIAKWVSQDGWDIVKDRKGGGTPKAREELLDFFEDSNADGDYIEDLIDDIVVDSHVLGDHLTELGMDDEGGLVDLSTIAGETVLIETDLDGNITGYIQRDPRSGKEIARLDPEDVMQFRRNARGRSLFGRSALKALFLAVESDVSAQLWNRDEFKNGNASRNAWVFPQDTSDPSMVTNETAITGARGPGGTHQDIILRAAGGEIKIHSLGVKPGEMEFQKLRKFNREEMLAVLGVPPMLLGILEAGSLGTGSGKEQIEIFIKGTIIPLQKRIARLFTDVIIKKLLGITGWKFVFKTEIPKDKKAIADTLKTLTEAGLITVDEGREDLGKPPLNEMIEDEIDAQERKLQKDLSSATGSTEISPIPGMPEIRPAVQKTKGGILQVLRRWRSRVNVRIKQTLAKQEILPDDFEEDIRARDMELVLLAGLGTASRAGLKHGQRLGGDQTDEALARTRALAEIKAQEIAAEIASDVQTQIKDAVVQGVEAGLGPSEIADDILEVFDEPRVIQVSASVNEAGEVIRVAHTRTLGAEAWAESTARFQASDIATQSSLTSLSAAGIDRVIWRTATTRVDTRICMPLDGKVFLLQDALQGRLIPAHNNCRCNWEPVGETVEITGTPLAVRVAQGKVKSIISYRLAKESRRRHEKQN